MAAQNPIPVYFNPEIGPNYKGISFEEIANSFNNGQQFSHQIQQQQQQGLLARLLAQNTNADGQVDLNKSLQSVQTNPNQSYRPEMVNTLSGLIQQRNVSQLKAQQEAEKFNLDISKGNAEVGEKQLGNTQKGQTLLSNLIATSPKAIAQSNSEKAKLYSNPNGSQQTPSEQSLTTSMAEVRQAAQKIGISVQDAVNMFKAQGVNIQ